LEQGIDLILIGGFLGAGKTTFLRRLLGEMQGRRLGVLVNEFGAVGVDGELLRGRGAELVELSNGSIFCSCLKQDFVAALRRFSETDIDALVIENSGMADPGGMDAILASLSPYLRRPYLPRGLLCLADCLTLPEYADVLLPVQHQLEEAALVLVNKLDLVSPARVREVHGAVRAHSAAPILDTVCGDVPAEALAALLSGGTPRRWAVCLLEFDGAVPMDAFGAFCAAAEPFVRRVRGFLPDGAGGWLTADTASGLPAGPTGEAAPDRDAERGQLVLLGRDERPLADRAALAWERCCGRACAVTEV